MVELTEAEMTLLRERAENLEAEARPRSFRQAIFELYPAIQKAINSGMARQQVYQKLLTDEIRQKIAASTFMNYYDEAKKAHEQKIPEEGQPSPAKTTPNKRPARSKRASTRFPERTIVSSVVFSGPNACHQVLTGYGHEAEWHNRN